jgi:hypothetical protein
MSRSIAVVLILGCVAVIGALAWLAGIVEPARLASSSAVVGGLALGVLAGLLTSFTGCTSVPTAAEFAAWKGKIEAAREKYRAEGANIQIKLSEIERLVERIEDEASNWVTSDEAKMAEWAGRIGRLRDAIETEKDAQAQTVELIVDTSEAIIERAEEVRAKAEQQLRQSSLAVPGATGQAQYVLGWPELMSESAALLAVARERLAEKRAQRERLQQHAEQIGPALARLGELAVGVSRESTLRRLDELDAVARSLVDRHAELLHLGFADGLDDVLAIAGYFISSRGPTLVVSVGPEVTTRTIPFTAKLELDERSVGGITAGDVLVLSLPDGFLLGAPLEITASAGIELDACGNEAGSGAVTLAIRTVAGEGPRALTIGIDQRLTVTARTGLGHAQVWSLRRNTGITLPVSALRC